MLLENRIEPAMTPENTHVGTTTAVVWDGRVNEYYSMKKPKVAKLTDRPFFCGIIMHLEPLVPAILADCKPDVSSGNNNFLLLRIIAPC